MSYFSLGDSTYKVPMKMHAENRRKLVDSLKSSTIFEKAEPKGIVLLQGGDSTNRYSSDNEPLFRQEPFFQYLFGVKEPGFYGAVDIDTGNSFIFIPRLPESYSWWMGKIQPPSFYKEMYEVDDAFYTDQLEKFFMDRNVSAIHTLYGLDIDSGNYTAEAKFPGIEKFKVNNKILHSHIVECRVFKSDEEIKLMRYVNKMSSDAHVEVMKKTRPGLCEHQIEAIFRYHTYYYGGCRNQAYTCICATGENGSVLHYGHAAAPNSKVLNDGDMALFDMGGEYHCYCSDITRSFPVNGKFSDDQKAIYETVLAAQEAVLKSMKPGVSWPDMHTLAYQVICEHLKKHGLLIGEVNEMMANNIPALFMPHGLGHFLGIETHDCGGYTKGMERSKLLGYKSLRAGRILAPRMVITVEPGVYFIESLLLEAFENPEKKRFLNVDRIKQFMKFGGVRIEDDVVVTETGIENFTTAPRTVEEIERIMAEGRK